MTNTHSVYKHRGIQNRNKVRLLEKEQLSISFHHEPRKKECWEKTRKEITNVYKNQDISLHNVLGLKHTQCNNVLYDYTLLKLQIHILKYKNHCINKSLQHNSERSIHVDSDLVWQSTQKSLILKGVGDLRWHEQLHWRQCNKVGQKCMLMSTDAT